MKNIKSQPKIFTKNEIVSIGKLNTKTISFYIKNQGNTDILLNDTFLMPVGSSGLSFSGEIGCYRKDEIKISFATGVGSLAMWYTFEA